MPQNRVALLDGSYHPVLSFNDGKSPHLDKYFIKIKKIISKSYCKLFL